MKQEKIIFDLGEKKIEANINRNGRAHKLKLVYKANGQLILTAPPQISYSEICRLSQKFLPWLKKNSQDSPELCLPEKISIPITEASVTVRLEKNLQIAKKEIQTASDYLLFTAGVKRFIFIINNNILTISGPVEDTPTAVAGLQIFFYKLAKNIVPDFILSLAYPKNFEIPEIFVRNQSSRWGSCSRQLAGAPHLNINWRILLLPHDLACHLCWHELTHIHHMNHSANFYAELEKHSAHCKEKEKELTKAWFDLPLWAKPLN